MKTVTEPAALRRKRRPIVLAAGYFDGVHLGHQAVLRRGRAEADRRGGELWVLTFDPHPLRVLNPARAPRLLTAPRHKLVLLERYGADGCLHLPFTPAVAATEPAAFLANLKREVPALACLLVGRDWRFGRGGRGDLRLARRLGPALGFDVDVARAVRRAGAAVSSTRIRAAVEQGELDLAARLLGRPFSILGTVRRGRGIGRSLGYPTANLDPHNEVLPPRGVYAVEADFGDGPVRGVVNYGRRPTFTKAGGAEIELHALAPVGDCYGRDVEVWFRRYLRRERRFPSTAALQRAIARDVARAAAS